MSFLRRVASMAAATFGSSHALTEARSIMRSGPTTSTSSGKVGPHMLSRAVVVTTAGAVSGRDQRQARGSVAKEPDGIRPRPGAIHDDELVSRRSRHSYGCEQWNSSTARGIGIETATSIWELLVGM